MAKVGLFPRGDQKKKKKQLNQFWKMIKEVLLVSEEMTWVL